MIRVAVATSGGRDSTALLHATVRAVRTLGGEVHALHVHHGLQPEADAWLLQVQRQARRWGAQVHARRLMGSPARGDSVEAWARKERYAALAEMAQAAACPLVLLAHHRRDQAETWLLQALRGGAVAGLSAMPGQAQRNGVSWARPWLNCSREAIEAYVRRHRLTFVDDPSNGDPRFARNRLRLQVWPALAAAFPEAEGAFAAAAAKAQRAKALADEVLALDLPSVAVAGGLSLAAWLMLPPARRRLALAGWLKARLGRSPTDAWVDRLLEELPRCRAARWVVAGRELRLYRGMLSLIDGAREQVPAGLLDSERASASFDPMAHSMRLDRPGSYPVPAWGGTLELTALRGGGVAAERLRAVYLRDRSGGERFRLAVGARPRSLKKQYQACGVPAWDRGGPLLFDAIGRLIFAPGLGVDADAMAGPGQEGLHVVWKPTICPR